jgi:hypothetical protein
VVVWQWNLKQAMISVPITTTVESSNPALARCTRYNIIWWSLSVTCGWFTPGTPVSSINKTDCHDIAKMLLKVALSTINLNILLAIVFTFLYDWLELKWKKKQISHCRNSSKTQTKNWPLTFMSWYRHFNESVWIKVIVWA